MRKKTFRPDGEISQTYNDGIVKIYSVADSAPVGHQPVEKLEIKYVLRFAERVLGITRLYLSRQHHAEIQRVIRVQRVNVSPQDVAITHDGKVYRIDTVQSVEGVYPKSLDLSLRLTDENLEVIPT